MDRVLERKILVWLSNWLATALVVLVLVYIFEEDVQSYLPRFVASVGAGMAVTVLAFIARVMIPYYFYRKQSGRPDVG